MKQKNKKHTFSAWLLVITSAVITFSFILSIFITMILAYLKVPSVLANTTLYFLLVLAISFVIDFAIIIPFSKRVTKNLQDIKNAMNKVSNGNLDVKLPPVKNELANELVLDFNRMIDELNSNKLLRSDFISNFSHEFKTPIVSVHGFAKILLENPDLPQEQKKEYLQIIVEQSERLSNLATNTLLISKINSQTIIEKQEFSLDENIRECILLFTGNEKVDISIDLDKVNIFANKDLLSQVWVNLINNALKYAKKKVKIKLIATKDTATFFISNDGTTITDEQKKRIFEKFYQIDNSHSSSGFGLGLSIAKKIVLLHNGTIECDNLVKNKTTFVVKLPIKKQD